jgi:hypothetical protein
VAGIQDVSEALLEDPRYVPDLKAKAGPSGAELRRAAIDLEKQTAAYETKTNAFRVGGEVEVTVLSGGQIVEDPPPLTFPNVGQSLLASRGTGIHAQCAPGTPAVTAGSFAEFQVEATGCTQPVDQIIFHDSIFTDSRLIYMGSSPLIFSDSNQIIRSTLTLGPSADLHNPTTEHLVCGFPWKAVYQNSKQITLSCPKNTP